MTREEIDAMATLLANQAGYEHAIAYNMVTTQLNAIGIDEPKPPVYYDTLEQANIARQREWDDSGNFDLTFFGVALAGEVGEACNIIKKLERERLGLKGSRISPKELAPELADVVIYASLCAIKAGIELDLAIFEKFNATSEKLGFRTRLRG